MEYIGLHFTVIGMPAGCDSSVTNNFLICCRMYVSSTLYKSE